MIRGYARFIVDGLDEDAPLRSDAVEIEKAAERAARLTSQLLVFSRHEVVQKRVVDVADVLSGLTSLLDRTLGENVRLLTDVERPLRRVEADPTPDRAGAREPRGERSRRHARPAATLRIELANVADGPGGVPAVRLTRARHGDRDGAGRARASLRALLHDEAEGRGHGPRPGDRLRHRHPDGRHDRDRLDPRRGDDDPGAAAGDRAQPPEEADADDGSMASRRARRSWWSRTRTPSGG